MPVAKKTLHASERDRPDVVEKRREWRVKTRDVDPRRLVFFDESGAKTNMIRTYGRAFGGVRLVDSAPQGHWATTTMLSSIRLDGSTAAMSLEGATDTTAFEAYIERVLLRTLKRGDILVVDNLQPHKSPRVAEMLAEIGVELWFLPPYSPDFNPIEAMWSKVKAFLRRVKARTKRALERAIGKALKTVTASDAKGWYRHCGYGQA